MRPISAGCLTSRKPTRPHGTLSPTPRRRGYVGCWPHATRVRLVRTQCFVVQLLSHELPFHSRLPAGVRNRYGTPRQTRAMPSVGHSQIGASESTLSFHCRPSRRIGSPRECWRANTEKLKYETSSKEVVGTGRLNFQVSHKLFDAELKIIV